MGQLVAIATYNRFLIMRGNNQISNTSAYFILDTGQIYTHGIFINGAVYGDEANGAVPITIAGVTKSLALGSHTHTLYHLKEANIDISTYKIVSGQNDLLSFASSTVDIGNVSSALNLNASTDPLVTIDDTTYTILNTHNFLITAIPPGRVLSLNNYALFKYGSSSFALDYVKRINTASAFDSLNSYTLLGTTVVNNKTYGYTTYYTDGSSPSKWALMRIDIAAKTLEIRTSSSPDWVGLLIGGTYTNLVVNGQSYGVLTTAASLPTIYAPSSLGTGGLYLTTADDGNSLVWRSAVNSWRSIIFKNSNDDTLGSLDSGTSTGAITFKSGNFITFSYSNGVATIASQDTWRGILVAGTSLAGTAISTKNINFVAGDNTTITYEAPGTSSGQSGSNDYFNIKISSNAQSYTFYDLLFLNVAGTNLDVYKPSTSPNKTILAGTNISFSTNNNVITINGTNTWTAFVGATSEAAGTAGYIGAVPAIGETNKFFRSDGSWQIPTNTTYKLTINNSTNGDSTSGTNLGTIYAPTSNGTGFLKGTAGNDGAITWSWDNSTYVSTSDCPLYTLTTSSILLNNTTWTETGLTNASTGLTTTGTYAVLIILGTGYYSGIMSWYAGTGGMEEEIDLHYAGNTTPTRLYMKTGGGKIYLAANATIALTTYTIKIRKLI